MHILAYRAAKLFGVLTITISGLVASLTVSPGQDVEYVKAIYGVFRLEGKSYKETARVLKNLGVNAAFIKPDSSLLAALHGEGIRVFVEIPIFVGESYWKSHPETRPIDSEGRTIEKREWYAGLCPSNDWLRHEKLGKVRKIVEQFAIDGLWLDFIRYPCHWEVEEPVFEETCFCPNCVSKFRRDTGVSIPEGLEATKSVADWILGNCADQWVAWRSGQITRFVGQAKKVLDEERPEALMGVFTVPWREKDYDNAIERVIGQDLEKLSQWVDVFSPMVYHKMCGKPVEWIGDICDYVSDSTGKDVLPIVQASDVSKEELARALKEGISSKSKGVIAFSLKWLLQEDRLSALKEAFGRNAE